MLTEVTYPKKRLKADDIIEYINSDDELIEVKAHHALYCTLNNGNNGNQDFNQIFEDYEIIYDETRQWLMIIMRNVRIKLRKYFYCAPIYVTIPINSHSMLDYFSPDGIRYYQKHEPLSWLREQPEEDAYNLGENPFQTAYHPHIDTTGTPCYGRWYQNMEDQITLMGKLETIRAFLNDYNGRSTFYTIDPYSHDRKHNTQREDKFPYYDYGLVKDDNNNRTFKVIHNIMTHFFDDAWYVDMAKDLGLNEEMTVISFDYFLNKIIEYDSYANGYLAECCVEQQIEGFEPAFYPSRDRLNSLTYDSDEWKKENESWMKRYDKYQKWQTSVDPYCANGWSRNIFQWLHSKLGYVFNEGDLKALQYGWNSWYKINLSHDANYNGHLNMLADNSSDGFRLWDMLRTMGFSQSGASIGSVTNGFGIIIMLIHNKDMPNILLNAIEFEKSVRDSVDTYQVNAIRKDVKRDIATDYEAVNVPHFFVWQDNSYNMLHADFQDKYIGYENGQKKQTLMIAALNRFPRVMADMVTNRNNRADELKVATFFSIMLNKDERLRYNTNWQEYFPIEELDEEKLFKDVMNKLLLDYLVVDFEGGHCRNWFYSELDKVMSNNEDMTPDKIRLVHTCFNGEVYEMEPDDPSRDKSIELGVLTWYRIFPEFPTSFNQIREFKNHMDKTLIIKSLQFYIARAQQKESELKDVLKDTVSSVEQGQLFPEQIPVN